MSTTGRSHFREMMAAIGAKSVIAIVVLTTVPSVWAQSATADPPKQVACIGIVTSTVEGVPGNAADVGNGARDLMASYLEGPSIKVVALEAKLPSLAAEEAKQKGCEPLLLTSVRRKSGGRPGFMQALSQAAGTASWSLPSGSSPASTIARAGAATGLQTVASLAQSTKAKDEISLEYQLQSADGHVLFGPRTEHQTAKSDGEDLLTPVVARAAEAIARNAAPQKGK